MKYILLFSIFFYSISNAQNIVLNEDFQNGIPSSWAVVNNDNNTVNSHVSEYTDAWIAKVDPENTADTVASSTSFFTSPADANRWLISPAITLGAFGNYITWEAKSHDPSFTEDYKVLISTSNAIESFSDTIQLVFEENYLWESHEVNLSDLGYDNQTVYIAFVLNTYDGFKLYVDDISVRSEDPVSVKELTHNSIEIYPNPCADILKINSNFNVEKVEILNQLGEIVITKSSNELNVSQLSEGIYFVKVYENNVYTTQKLVIKH